MNLSYSEKAKSKNSNELLQIILNKEDYNPELVAAAETELRLRNDFKDNKEDIYHKSFVGSNIPSISNLPSKEKPIGLYFCAVLFFIMSIFYFFINLSLIGGALLFDNSQSSILGLINIIFAILYIPIGIGILKTSKWGYNWGIGTAFINILVIGYSIYEDPSLYFIIPLFPYLLILIILRGNKSLFYNQDIAEDIFYEELAGKDPKNVDLIKLFKFIEEDKNSIFSKNKNKILEVLSEYCTDERSAKEFLNSYKIASKRDLINDLKDLSTNYEVIKEYLQPFIDFSIIEEKYPHNFKLLKT